MRSRLRTLKRTLARHIVTMNENGNNYDMPAALPSLTTTDPVSTCMQYRPL